MLKKIVLLLVVGCMLGAVPVYADNDKSWAEELYQIDNYPKDMLRTRLMIASLRMEVESLKKESQYTNEMLGVMYGYLFLIAKDPGNTEYYFSKMEIEMKRRFGFNIDTFLKGKK